MRPEQTQTGKSSHWPPYISSQTGLTLPWLLNQDEINSCTGLSWYRSHLNDNKSQTRLRSFKPVCFSVGHVFIRQNIILSFRQENRHQAFRPGFM